LGILLIQNVTAVETPANPPATNAPLPVTITVDDVKLCRKACPETLMEITPDIFDVLKNCPSWIATISNRSGLLNSMGGSSAKKFAASTRIC
jgi:hypothetical protein